MAVDTTAEGAAKDAKERSERVAHFLNEIDAARKREKDFRKEGQDIIDLYTGEKSNPFAILYSNTETMLPALYSAVPRPVVQRRFKDEDPLGKMASSAGQRGLEFLLDTNTEGYETFDSAMRSAVMDGLLPGRGVTAVKYEAEVQDTQPDGAAEGAEPIPVKNWETVCPDSVSWDRFLHGYARKWSKVPWISYEMHLDKDQCLDELKFDEATVAKITFTEGEAESKEGDEGKNEDERNLGERKTATFYQVWDRDGGRKVRYICPQYKDDFCKVEDDPLGITGFFNCPKPIQFLEKSNDLLPSAIYELYKEQAEELNELTRRIRRLAKAIKAKALYDTELGDDIKKLMDDDELTVGPADKSSSLAAEKGMDNAVWFWPVDKLIIVLRELYVAREACKHVIYEITGIADILRGNTNASETLGAQEIKEKWGGLRLKRLQKEVQRYARDMLRMMLDVAALKFSERTWAQMTGLPFLLEEKFNELTAVAKALDGQVQQEQLLAQQAQMQGQPAQPGPAAQQLAQVKQQLQTPRWSQVLEMLRDDMQRAYRIDIETNSTVEPEAVEDQKNISDVMTALGQFLNGITPLIVSGSMPFQAAQAMMLAIVRRYRFGNEIEDYIKAMTAPKPPDDGKEKAAQAADGKAMQAEMRAQQSDMKAAQADAQVKHVQDEVKLKDFHSTNTQAQAERKAELDRREQALVKEEEARALREELANSRLETQIVREGAARDKLAGELKLMVKTLEGNLKIAQKSAADATTAAKQQGAKDADAQKNAKAQAQSQEAQAAMGDMMKGFQEVVGKLNETLAVLAGPRKLDVDRNDKGKVTGGMSKPVGSPA